MTREGLHRHRIDAQSFIRQGAPKRIHRIGKQVARLRIVGLEVQRQAVALQPKIDAHRTKVFRLELDRHGPTADAMHSECRAHDGRF